MIKNVRAPYGEVGKLESAWYPLVLDAEGRTVDPENDSCNVELPDIDSPKVLNRLGCFPPRLLWIVPSIFVRYMDEGVPRDQYGDCVK